MNAFEIKNSYEIEKHCGSERIVKQKAFEMEEKGEIDWKIEKGVKSKMLRKSERPLK